MVMHNLRWRTNYMNWCKKNNIMCLFTWSRYIPRILTLYCASLGRERAPSVVGVFVCFVVWQLFFCYFLFRGTFLYLVPYRRVRARKTYQCSNDFTDMSLLLWFVDTWFSSRLVHAAWRGRTMSDSEPNPHPTAAPTVVLPIQVVCLRKSACR